MMEMLVAPPNDEGWFKSTFSAGTGNCVEFRFVEAGIQLRDDKGSDSPVLTFSVAEWDAFLLGAFNGEFTIR
ncbi:DUF397 domain-containing protein [Streptomyces decoyicus]|uniref:DUF397 domain-containing protein n=1 Tax=Streptomyces decoyicus TaxID=249567 RepID=UPI00362FBD4D